MKILPYETKPLFEYTPKSTYLLSIIHTCTNSSKWISSNYGNIQITKYEKYTWDMFCNSNEWENCTHLEILKKNYTNIKKMYNNFTDFVINSIDNNYYVYAVINTKYIPAYNSKNDFSHNMIIYGYDSVEKLIYFSDFFAGGKYGTRTCSFDELNIAFKELDSTENYSEDDKNLEIIKIIDTKFKFDLTKLLTSTKHFIDDNYNESNIYYGLSCLDFIAESILKKSINKRYLSLILAVIELWKLRISVIDSEYNTTYNSKDLMHYLDNLTKLAKENQLMMIKIRTMNNNKYEQELRNTISSNIAIIKSTLKEICITILDSVYTSKMNS